MMLWTYQIELSGLLDGDTLAVLEDEFDGALTMTEPAGTLLTGTAADQAALLGILDRLHSLGLQVREFRRVPDTPDPTTTRSVGTAPGARPERPRR
jgi:hypothetical protein